MLQLAYNRGVEKTVELPRQKNFKPTEKLVVLPRLKVPTIN